VGITYTNIYPGGFNTCPGALYKPWWYLNCETPIGLSLAFLLIQFYLSALKPFWRYLCKMAIVQPFPQGLFNMPKSLQGWKPV
jgi:hypothetical protein